MSRWVRLPWTITPLGSLALIVCAPAWAQLPLIGSDGQLRIYNTDMAVLEAQDVRKDVPCSVSPTKPVLGFDLRFHTGYEISIPLRELAGGENQLTVLFRVTPENRRDDSSYFVQHFRVPRIDDDAKGDATLDGAFDLGEGNYHVDWLLRDRSERVCSFYWDTEASLPSKDKQIELTIPPTGVQKAQFEQFSEEPPVERAQTAPPINVKLLVNFAPQNFESSTLRPQDTVALVSILRRISREPQ